MELLKEGVSKPNYEILHLDWQRKAVSCLLYSQLHVPERYMHVHSHHLDGRPLLASRKSEMWKSLGASFRERLCLDVMNLQHALDQESVFKHRRDLLHVYDTVVMNPGSGFIQSDSCSPVHGPTPSSA